MSFAILSESVSERVHADIGFLIPTPGRPFAYGRDARPDDPPATAEFTAQRVQIGDARRVRLSLDANGAALLSAPTGVDSFDDDERVVSEYYPECAEIIRAALGAREVIVYDHNIRRGTALAPHPNRDAQGRPVLHAHTDYTEVSAARRLGELLGPLAPLVSRRRRVQVNLWRPIRAPLRDAPLAICDAASLAPGALRPTDLRYADRSGELYYLVHHPDQRWYYAPDMRTDEVWLMKNFDSDAPRVALAAPHSAFEDPAPRGTVLPRESIEVRAFALFHA